MFAIRRDFLLNRFSHRGAKFSIITGLNLYHSPSSHHTPLKSNRPPTLEKPTSLMPFLFSSILLQFLEQEVKIS